MEPNELVRTATASLARGDSADLALEALESSCYVDERAPLGECFEAAPLEAEITQWAAALAESLADAGDPIALVWIAAPSTWGGRLDGCDLELVTVDDDERETSLLRRASPCLSRIARGVANVAEDDRELRGDALLAMAVLLAFGVCDRLDASFFREGPCEVECRIAGAGLREEVVFGEVDRDGWAFAD